MSTSETRTTPVVERRSVQVITKPRLTGEAEWDVSKVLSVVELDIKAEGPPNDKTQYSLDSCTGCVLFGTICRGMNLEWSEPSDTNGFQIYHGSVTMNTNVQSISPPCVVYNDQRLVVKDPSTQEKAEVVTLQGSMT